MSEETELKPPRSAAEILKSPGIQEVMREIEFNISPEQLAVRNEHHRQFLQRQDEFKVEELRRNWGAPRRHLLAQPKCTGAWGEKLSSLRERFIHQSGQMIALIGERGNGKTQLAVELMRWFTSLQKSALFTTAISFFIEVKTTYRQDSVQTEKSIMAKYGKPKLLVVDEIGKRSDTDWENNMFFELLNGRYNDVMDTILIANKSKPEFIEYIGPSIASRMNETGGIIECNWPSFRG